MAFFPSRIFARRWNFRVQATTLSALLGFWAGCTSSPSSPPAPLLPSNAAGVVILPLGTAPADVGGNPPLWAVRLVPFLQGPLPRVRLVALRQIPDDNGGSIGGELWEVVSRTRGDWTQALSGATYLEWKLDDRNQSRAFAASRQELFALYRKHVPELAQFILLRRAGDPTRFLAIGFFGLTAFKVPREQPDIQAFEAVNPLTRWTAHEAFGQRSYLVHRL